LIARVVVCQSPEQDRFIYRERDPNLRSGQEIKKFSAQQPELLRLTANLYWRRSVTAAT
jgi:hypothetical protein